MCFSALIHKVSYMDPRIAVPVRINIERYAKGSKSRIHAQELLNKVDNVDVLETFKSICNTNFKRIGTLNEVEDLGKTKIISKDARRLTSDIQSKHKLGDESIDLILTSPPYAGAQKYIRSSSLSLYWLKMLEGKSLVEMDEKNIGHENYKKKDLVLQSVGIDDADEIIDKIFKKIHLEGKL